MNMKYRKSKMSREVNIPIDGRKIRVCAKKRRVYGREEGGSNRCINIRKKWFNG